MEYIEQNNTGDTINPTDYFSQMKNEQVKKLTDVGFTQEQAQVLLDLMQQKAFSGGMF